jgi:hypothetical protein
MRCSGEVWRPLQRQLRPERVAVRCRFGRLRLPHSRCTAVRIHGQSAAALHCDRRPRQPRTCHNAGARRWRVFVCVRRRARTPWQSGQRAAARMQRTMHGATCTVPADCTPQATASVQQPAYTIQRTTYSSADHAHTHRDSRTTAVHDCSRAARAAGGSARNHV